MSLEGSWSQAIRASLKRLWNIDLDGSLLEPPADPKFGDATCNAAMRLAKQLKKPSRAIADELAADLRKAGLPHLAKVEVAGAGFVNLTAAPDFYHEEVKRILTDGANYGRSTLGAGRKVLVEHCSANPTGPLHIAHGRQAAVGDSLANLLDFAGFKVGRDFYINDTGNQIEMLGRSILWRLYEAEGKAFTRFERGFEEEEQKDEKGNKIKVKKALFWLSTEIDGKTWEICETNAYKGDYVRDLGAELKAQGGPIDLERAKRFGKDRLLDEIKRDLETFRVKYDTWVSEESLHKSGKVDEVLNFFTTWGYTYTKNGATYLKTSDEGDPEDRAILKADGGYVYRLPDLAYHKDKYERGFDILIDLMGPDHHAHIATMKAGLKALNFNLAPIDEVRAGSTLPPEQKAVAFEVLIIQAPVRLVFTRIRVRLINLISRLVNQEAVFVLHGEIDKSRSLLREPGREAMTRQRDRSHADVELASGFDGLVGLVGIDSNGSIQKIRSAYRKTIRDAVFVFGCPVHIREAGTNPFSHLVVAQQRNIDACQVVRHDLTFRQREIEVGGNAGNSGVVRREDAGCRACYSKVAYLICGVAGVRERRHMTILAPHHFTERIGRAVVRSFRPFRAQILQTVMRDSRTAGVDIGFESLHRSAAGNADIVTGIAEVSASQERPAGRILIDHMEVSFDCGRELKRSDFSNRVQQLERCVRKSIMLEASVEIGLRYVMAEVARDSIGPKRGPRTWRHIAARFGRQNLMAAGIHHRIVTQRSEEVRLELGADSGKFRHLARQRIFAHLHHMGIVASQTKTGRHLVDV